MVYLFKGSDDYSKNKELEKLINENIDPDYSVFDLEETFGENVTYDRVINGASIVPVGSKNRVFVIRFAQKIPLEDQKVIAKNLDRVDKDGILIFHTPAPLIKDGKISASSEVCSDLEKSIKKNGKVLDFAVYTKKKDIETKVIPFVKELFSQKKIQPSAINLFVERVGTNFVLLNTEAQKVLAYAMNEPVITEQIIKEVTSATVEEKVFDFLEFVINKNSAKALSGVNDLFTDGNDPRAVALKIITLLRGQVNQLWQGLILIKLNPKGLNNLFASFVTTGVKKEDISEEYLKYFPGVSLLSKAPWQQGKIVKAAKKTSFINLAKWIFYLEEADMSLKNYEGSGEEPIDVIKMLTYKMVR